MTLDALTAAPPRKAARLSECGTYRYWLTRVWDMSVDSLVFVMLNPSTADAELDDPTIRRCMGFAKREGFGGVSVMNLYAFRATDPKVLRTLHGNIDIGPENDGYLRMTLTEQARRGNPVVAAWGANADPLRADKVLNMVPSVAWRCLGVTKARQPKHPLYVRGDQPLEPFSLPRP